MPKITLDDVMAGKLRDAGHMNYGPNGHGYPKQHTTIGRLSCIDRYYKGAALKKAGVPSERLWCVDGIQVESLEVAISRLNTPPVLSFGEFVVLSRLPGDFDWLRAVQARLAGITEAEVPVCTNDHPRYHAVTMAIHRLRELGLVELEPRPVECRSDFGPRTMPTIRRAPAPAQHTATRPLTKRVGGPVSESAR